MAVRHIFLWSVRPGADGAEVLSKLAALETDVPGIQGWSIGRHAGEDVNSSVGKWEYAITCDFESFEALAAYPAHPRHTAVVDEVMGTYDDWLVLDYEL
jgi:hypothetical protein